MEHIVWKKPLSLEYEGEETYPAAEGAAGVDKFDD